MYYKLTHFKSIPIRCECWWIVLTAHREHSQANSTPSVPLTPAMIYYIITLFIEECESEGLQMGSGWEHLLDWPPLDIFRSCWVLISSPSRSYRSHLSAKKKRFSHFVLEIINPKVGLLFSPKSIIWQFLKHFVSIFSLIIDPVDLCFHYFRSFWPLIYTKLVVTHTTNPLKSAHQDTLTPHLYQPCFIMWHTPKLYWSQPPRAPYPPSLVQHPCVLCCGMWSYS